MTFPLLSKAGDLGDRYLLLTEAQLARMAEWSYMKERDVRTLLREAQFICKPYGDGDGSKIRDGREVILEGLLPHCGLYGALLPDGSTHT